MRLSALLAHNKKLIHVLPLALIFILLAGTSNSVWAAKRPDSLNPILQSQHLPLTSLGRTSIPRGGGIIPGGYNPFGYKITAFGEHFLQFDGSLDSDVGRFISTLKSGRKRFAVIKEQWLEVMRVSKSGQNMRIYRKLQELVDFCVKAGLID